MNKNVKKIVGAAALAAALGLSSVAVGDGVANAAVAPTTPAQTVEAPADSGVIHAQPIDHGWGHGGWGHGGWGWGGHGHWGDWGPGWGWGWGWR
jgi:hypothetical protein